MNRLNKLFLAACLLFPITALAMPDFEQLDRSVVRVVSIMPNGEMGMGTGFVINEQQNVVTNYHVIKGYENLLIADDGIDQAHLKEAEIKWASEERDLAILHVPDLHRPSLQLSSIEPAKGTQIYTIGFPGAADLLTEEISIESSVTTGSVSRVINAAWEPNAPFFRIVQHSSEINSGNSGGPLINACGQVVGINTIKTSLAASIATGEIISGVFYASHISSLVEILNATQIPYHEVNTICTPTKTVSNEVKVAILAVALAIIAVLLSMTRTRKQAVETYTQWIRRTNNPSTNSWELSGLDKQGEPIHLTINETQLQQANASLTIGRSAQLSDLVINDDRLSRRHARLFYREKHLYVEDMNSLNGTKVDGIALDPFKPMMLTSGSTLILGNIKLSLN